MRISPYISIFLKRAACAAVVCGLPLALSAQTQPNLQPVVYSSSSAVPQYQYDNPGYPPPPPPPGYGPRHTPRYTGTSWADHWVFEGGGGVTAPAGDTQNWANTGWNVLLGTGYKFNERLSLLAEWHFNDLGVPHSLANVIAGVPDGNEHLWTANLNPKINFLHDRMVNGYLIGGGGFSRALVNYTAPVVFNCYDYFFGPYPCSGSITVAKTSSNQGNVDIGLGGEWRLSPYERGALFLEARYDHLFTPKTGLPPGEGANMVPVTIGYRW